MANPRKLRAIYANNRKSDRTDARMLARLARVDPELLHPIQHGGEEAQRDLLQVKLRDNLVSQRVNIISSVRFILKSLGIRLPSPNTACFAKRCRKLLSGEHGDLLVMVEPSLDILDALTRNIRELERRIVLSQYLNAIQSAQKYPPQETGLRFEMDTPGGVAFDDLTRFGPRRRGQTES